MPLRARKSWGFFAVAVIFGLAAIDSLMHIVTLRPYGELPVSWGTGFAILGVVLPLGAALALIFRDRSPRAFTSAFDVSLFGVLWLNWHGLAIRLLGDLTGIAYILASLVAAYLLRKGFAPVVHPASERPAQPVEDDVLGPHVAVDARVPTGAHVPAGAH